MYRDQDREGVYGQGKHDNYSEPDISLRDQAPKKKTGSRGNHTASGIDVRWSQDAWARSEVKLGDFDLLVLKNLVCAAKNKRDDSVHFTVMGEYLYQAVRPTLNTDKIKLLDAIDSRSSTPSISSLSSNGKQGNKKGGKKGGGGNKAKRGPSKADQIRMQNSVGTLCTKLETSLKAFYDGGDDFRRPKLFLEKIVEMRGIGFLCCAWYLLTKRKQLDWDKELTVLTYSIIVSLERFIKTTPKLKGKSHLDSSKEDTVAPSLITDLESKLLELKDKFQFSGEKIYLEAPQLLIFSDFDDTLPVSSVKPYPHQARICQIMEQNLENGFYVMYRAVTNAGKTTTIVSLAATVQKIREQRGPEDFLSKLQIIFCCGSPPVKDQATQWLYNSTNVHTIQQLPFAIAFEWFDASLQIRNSFMCRNEKFENPLVIVCSPAIALRIIKERGQDAPYILFHDEPTIGAEDAASKEIRNNVALLRFPPKWTIVSSATLPSEEQLTPFIRRHEHRFKDAHHENIASSTINIGCDVYSHSGTTFLPHIGCDSQESLAKCISNIDNNLFLSRTYTPLAVSEICELASEYDSLDIPDIGKHFSNIDNLTADAVRRYGLQILDKLAKTDDKTVASLCSKPIIGSSRSVDFAKLGTSEAHKFPLMSLVASDNPVECAVQNFAALLNDIKAAKIYTIDKLVAQFWKVQEQWSDELEKLKKRRKKPPSSNKRRNSEGEVEREEVDYAQLEMDLQANEPFISFPECYQINTRKHAEQYSPDGRVQVERYQLPDFSFITDTKIVVSNDVLLLLCCGVGIYAPEHEMVKNDGYLSLVKYLAQSGRLAYLVADHNIAYGVNFPFSRTIVCEDFTAKHSMNTVFQLMSRAGRVGQSWFAESFVSNAVVESLRNYSHHNTSPDSQLEIENMMTVLRLIVMKEREAKEARH